MPKLPHDQPPSPHVPIHSLPHKVHSLVALLRLPNQIGTLLLLFPALWALVLGSHGSPTWDLVLIFTLGAFLMRSAGVVMNDLADRSFDRLVERTQHRPLASGALQPLHAKIMLGILLTLATCLLGFLNLFTILLSPVALILAALYPFTKRFFSVPQLFLGLAFGWGTVMAWAAIRNHLDVPTWLLYGATILWAIAYDTIYALQDRQDDLKIGIHSSAIFFGSKIWLAVGLALTGVLVLLGLAGFWEQLNLIFYGALVGVAGFFVHQVRQLRHPLEPFQARRMFQQHTYIGLLILTGLWLGSW